MASSGKILVAEDEKPIAKALTLKLQHSGFEVVTVGNGKEAIDRIVEEKFDLILLDLIMPVMDGFKVLEEMKEKGITCPVIVLSNLSLEDDLKKSKELGARGYFIKSNTPIAHVVVQIERVLNDPK